MSGGLYGTIRGECTLVDCGVADELVLSALSLVSVTNVLRSVV